MKVKVETKVDADGHVFTTDGVHLYFPCTYTTRVRWALMRRPDDGVGLRTHGAGGTLEEAVQDAWGVKSVRDEVTP
jgi:hypothetical protein